jgi:hypothetical protein
MLDACPGPLVIRTLTVGRANNTSAEQTRSRHMALKSVLTTKAEADALPESLKSEYTERDGKWFLNVDGMVTKTEHDELKVKLGEFRDNNKTLFEENKDLKAIKDKVKGINDLDAYIAEHATLKTQVDDFKKKGITGTSDLDAAIAAAVKPIKDSLAAAETARLDAEKRVNESRFRELITADATKAGVKPQSIRHVLREAEEKFEYKNGAVVPKAGVKHPTEPLKDYTPTDWLGDLAKSDEYLFGDSTGGGATGGRGTPPKDVKELVNPTPEEKGRHMDDIASGKMVVVHR